MTQWFGTKEEFVYFGLFGLEGEGELAQFAMRHKAPELGLNLSRS